MNCGACNHHKVCRCFPNPEEYCSDYEPERKHGEWVSKPKRVQVDETDEERIFETRQEWFCSSCGKSFGFRNPEDDFCKYCGSDNRSRILDESSDGEGKDGNVKEGEKNESDHL